MGEENHGKPFGFCGCFKARTGAIVTAVLSMVGKNGFQYSNYCSQYDS